jgi:SAM-dependent methyltransferase
LGAGDCALSLEIAKRVKHVFAVDVSEQITAGVQTPDNLTVVICDGCTIPLPANTVDVVYSNQLIEHVHPDDLASARECPQRAQTERDLSVRDAEPLERTARHLEILR